MLHVKKCLLHSSSSESHKDNAKPKQTQVFINLGDLLGRRGEKSGRNEKNKKLYWGYIWGRVVIS